MQGFIIPYKKQFVQVADMLKWSLLLFTVIIIAVLIFLGQKRKDLPFQEIVSFDKSIGIINDRNWYISDIDIYVSSKKNNIPIQYKYNENGYCIISNLINNQKYTIQLARTDLKGRLLYRKKTVTVTPKKISDKYIILIGASVGSGWNYDRITDRIQLLENMVFGFRPHYFFDKGLVVRSIINLPLPVYSVIIKECSAYFPRNTDDSIMLVRKWVAQLKKKKILPVLATVVPVTEKQDRLSPGKLESLLRYNDALKQFAVSQKIPILDLEKTLRVSAENRHLRQEYAQHDGTHLTPPGYSALDAMMKNQYKQIFRIKE